MPVRFVLLWISALCVAPADAQKFIEIEHKPGWSNLGNTSTLRRSDGLFAESNSFGIADIRPLVSENSTALTHAQTSAEQNRIASIWFWSTVPVGFGARLATYPLVELDVITRQTGWIIFGSGIAVSLIGAVISLHYFNNAKFSMYLGIKEYNHPTSVSEPRASAYFGGLTFRLR